MTTRFPLIILLSVFSFFAQSQIITFDFNNGLQGWQLFPNNSVNTNGGEWQLKDYGKADGGTYWNNRDSIYSDSKGAAIMLDGDELFSNGLVQNSDLDVVAEIRSGFIDFSSFSNKVYLKFFQYYRNFDSSTRVEVSGDGGTNWDVYPVNQNVLQNVETSAGSFQIIDITNTVGAVGEGLVRFVFEGKNYFWIIDDVEFYDEDPSPNSFPEYVGDSLTMFGYPVMIDSSDWPIVPNELVVQFKSTTTEAEKQALRDSLGVVKIDSCVCNRLELWAIGEPGDTTLSPTGNTIGINEKAKGSKASSKVDGVDFNRYNYNELKGATDVPNPDLATIGGVPSAIPNTPAGATLIAILDTGIDIDHPELVKYIRLNDDALDSTPNDNDANCLPNDPIGWNYVDDNNNPDDDHSHGTHVAGIVVNTLKSYENLIDCEFRIVPYKTHDYHGVSNLFDVTCATYQAKEDEVSVINDSWGFYGDSSIILSNAIDTIRASDILIVTAAGNDTIDLEVQAQYPACYVDSNVVTVGAYIVMDSPSGGIDTLVSGFSNFSNICVDIVAPGNDILSTVPDGLMDFKSGTSMAAPAVAAVAAIFDCYGNNDFAETKDSLLSCAKENTIIDDKVMDGNILFFDVSCLPIVGVEDVVEKEIDISIFPNPTSDVFFIQPKKEMKFVQIRLLDINGKTIFIKHFENMNKDSKERIDLSNLPSGIYLLNVQHSSYIWSHKMIKT